MILRGDRIRRRAAVAVGGIAIVLAGIGAAADEPNAGGTPAAGDAAPTTQTAQASQPEEEITVTAKRLEAARIEHRAAGRRIDLQLFERRDLESAGRRGPAAQPGAAAGAGRGPGQPCGRRDPHPQRASRGSVPHQRHRAAGRRELLRAGPRSALRQFDAAHHRHAAGGIRPAHRGHRRYPDEERPLPAGRIGRDARRQLRHRRSRASSMAARPAATTTSSRAITSNRATASKRSRRPTTRSTTTRCRRTPSSISTRSSIPRARSRSSAARSRASFRFRTIPDSRSPLDPAIPASTRAAPRDAARQHDRRCRELRFGLPQRAPDRGQFLRDHFLSAVGGEFRLSGLGLHQVRDACTTTRIRSATCSSTASRKMRCGRASPTAFRPTAATGSAQATRCARGFISRPKDRRRTPTRRCCRSRAVRRGAIASPPAVRYRAPPRSRPRPCPSPRTRPRPAGSTAPMSRTNGRSCRTSPSITAGGSTW